MVIVNWLDNLNPALRVVVVLGFLSAWMAGGWYLIKRSKARAAQK